MSGKESRLRSRAGKTLLILVMITAAVVAGLIWRRAHDETAYPIRFVRVEGDTRHVDVAQVRETVAPRLKGGYFSIDLRAVEAAAKRVAWIHQARVVRLWPDTIILRLTEQIPSVRWGGRSLLSEQGVRFSPDNIKDFAQLPVIQGAEGQELFLLALLKNLSDRLDKSGMRLATLYFSKRRALIVKLADGMEIHFGRQDPVSALDRFLALLPRLGAERIKAIGKVDLRYPNGFSLHPRAGADRLKSEHEITLPDRDSRRI